MSFAAGRDLCVITGTSGGASPVWYAPAVDGPARHRLYRAIASEPFLGKREMRRPVRLP
jgi:hypothetical protein